MLYGSTIAVDLYSLIQMIIVSLITVGNIVETKDKTLYISELIILNVVNKSKCSIYKSILF